MPAVFLTHASLPSRIAADSESTNSAFVGLCRNRLVRGMGWIQSKGFNFGAIHEHGRFHHTWRTEIVGKCGWD
jgi:hypothetical protein